MTGSVTNVRRIKIINSSGRVTGIKGFLAMNSISRIFFPVRPLPSVSDNCVPVFHIYDERGKKESCVDLNEMCLRQSKESYFIYNVVAGMRGRKVTRFEIPVTHGESIYCVLQPEFQLGFYCQNEFIGKAYRHRNVKIFLIKDPSDEQVQQAAKKICHKRYDVFVLVDELPDLSARKSSFLTLLLEYDDVLQANQGVDWKRLIISLAKSGFYFKDGFVRCNGCAYRKHAREFVDNISRSFGGQCDTETSRFRFLQPFSGTKILCDHDHSNCYLTNMFRKTLFTAGDTCEEQGHYQVYHHGNTNYYLDKRVYSVPMPYEKVKELPKSKQFLAEVGIDRFLHEDKSAYIFTTTVPKKDFLTQDDLFYEVSDIKMLFDKLRQDYVELNRMVDRFGEKYPVLADDLCFPSLHGLLATEFGKIYFKMINTIAETDADGLLCHSKPQLRELLDQLMTLIAGCGGVVAEKGLMCLSIEPGAKTQYEFFHYGTSGQSDELVQIRHRWMELGIDYLKLVSDNIFSPLLDIFSPVELGHEIMYKLFGASEIYLECLLRHVTIEDTP